MKRRKLNKSERLAVYDKTNGHCAYCGKEITLQQMQVDHVVPVEFYEAYKAMGQDLNAMDILTPYGGYILGP